MTDTPRPFLGVLDGFPADAAHVVVAIPCGRERGVPQWPGLFWRFAWCSPERTPIGDELWRPFTSGRLHRLVHFGVSVSFAPIFRTLTIIEPQGATRSRAGRIDGTPIEWLHKTPATLLTHDRITKEIATAVKHFERDPLPPSPAAQ